MDYLLAAGMAAARAPRWALTPLLGPVQPFAPGVVAIGAAGGVRTRVQDIAAVDE